MTPRKKQPASTPDPEPIDPSEPVSGEGEPDVSSVRVLDPDEADELRHQCAQARRQLRQWREKWRTTRSGRQRRALRQRIEALQSQWNCWRVLLEQQQPASADVPFPPVVDEAQPAAAAADGKRELVDREQTRDFLNGEPAAQTRWIGRYFPRMLEACHLCLLGVIDPTHYAGPTPARKAYYILPQNRYPELEEIAYHVVTKVLDKPAFRASLAERLAQGDEITPGYLLGAVVRELTVSNIQPVLKTVFGSTKERPDTDLVEQRSARNASSAAIASRQDWKAAFLQAGFHAWEFEYLWYRFGNWPVVATAPKEDRKAELSIEQVVQDLDKIPKMTTDANGFPSDNLRKRLQLIAAGLSVRIEGRTSPKAPIYALQAVEKEVQNKWPQILAALALEKIRPWSE